MTLLTLDSRIPGSKNGWAQRCYTLLKNGTEDRFITFCIGIAVVVPEFIAYQRWNGQRQWGMPKR